MAASAPSLLWPDILQKSDEKQPYSARTHESPIPTLVDILFSQAAQIDFISEFVAEVEAKGYDDAEVKHIIASFRAVTGSPVPLPLELTWIVLIIMYVCTDAVVARLLLSTPPSLVRAWFVSTAEFRAHMENCLCGKFVAMGPGRARRGRVVAKCLTPVEIVTAAWSKVVFEVTKPPDIVARENTSWN